MSNLYVALDEDCDGNVLIRGIFPSLSLLKNSVEYTEICRIDLDSLDKGIYIEDDILNLPKDKFEFIYD